MKPLRLSWKYAIVFALAIIPFILARCGDDHKISIFTSQTVPITAQNSAILNGQTFNFTSGAVLDSTLTGQPVTVTFSNFSGANGNFSMTSGTHSADGEVTIGSFFLRVLTSTFPPGQGPQVGELIPLDGQLEVTIAGLGIGTSGIATTELIFIDDQGGEARSSGIEIDIEVKDDGSLFIGGINTGTSLPFTGTGTVISLISPVNCTIFS